MTHALYKTLEAFAAVWYETGQRRNVYYLDWSDDAALRNILASKVIRITIEIKDEDPLEAVYKRREERKEKSK